MIGDMPLLHIEQSPSFWIERSNQEKECLKSLFKDARLQKYDLLFRMRRVRMLIPENFPFVFSFDVNTEY